ncbi:nucleolar protein 12 [Lepisosteus oculatus]|uniref:nucleolar protein 12 n=1 Tax=Lepisosteus oculatus TaxID=7918 RepID=UPI0035F52DF2
MAKKKKLGPGAKRRERKTVVTFNDKDRHDYLTGFHKRKLERRKVAVEEIKQKLKEEQRKVREERHKEYLKMLKERKEALEEADELEELVTGKTESVQYDHPNHTVTVTTISDLDLSGARLLGLETNQGTEESEEEKGGESEEEEEEKNSRALPKKAGDPIMSKKLSSLTASLHAHTKTKKKKGWDKRKGKEGVGRGRVIDRKGGGATQKLRLGRTSKKQRRQRTGRRYQQKD